jgi:hypothetical protein
MSMPAHAGSAQNSRSWMIGAAAIWAPSARSPSTVNERAPNTPRSQQRPVGNPQVKDFCGAFCKTVGAVAGVCPATVTKLGLCLSQRVIGFAGHRAAILLRTNRARGADSTARLGGRADLPVRARPGCCVRRLVRPGWRIHGPW